MEERRTVKKYWETCMEGALWDGPLRKKLPKYWEAGSEGDGGK